MEHNKKQSRVLKWSLIIGVVIVLNLFFNYAISLIYPSPEYQKFCPDEQVISPPATKTQCVAIGGQWTENTYPKGEPIVEGVKQPPQVQGYCNPTYTCQKNYDAVRKVYERNVFVALIILGIISLLCGMFLKIGQAVSVGLSFGGVLSLVIASMRYWSEAGNMLRVVILAIALIALIWVGVKKFQD